MADSMNLELDTVRILIERIRSGDQSAQSTAESELVNHIQSYVSIMADQKLDPKFRAHVGPSDIVQQTLMKIVDGIDQFQGESTQEFFGWVNRIVQNETLKSYRDLTRQKRDVRRERSLVRSSGDSLRLFELEEKHRTPQSNALAVERVQLFHAALGRLPEEYATVIRLRNLEQLPFVEVADRMGRTENSASKLWYRAVLKFKQELEALDDNSRQR